MYIQRDTDSPCLGVSDFSFYLATGSTDLRVLCSFEWYGTWPWGLLRSWPWLFCPRGSAYQGPALMPRNAAPPCFGVSTLVLSQLVFSLAMWSVPFVSCVLPKEVTPAAASVLSRGSQLSSCTRVRLMTLNNSLQ